MGRQIGSDDTKTAVPLRNSIYKASDGGKGARPRPGVYSQQYKDNWEKIFGKKSNTKHVKAKD